jgi:hypothetical protein
MLRRQNRPPLLRLWSWPKKDYCRRIHFGPRWLRVRSGFDDGGEEQKVAKRESRLVELDIVGKYGMSTGCRRVLEGRQLSRVGVRTPSWRDEMMRVATTYISPKEEDVHNGSFYRKGVVCKSR